MSTKTIGGYQNSQTLPLIGNLRWKHLEPFVGVCREKWRVMCHEGRAPKGIRISPRCTVWQAEEIHKYLADPLGYRAE